MAPSGSTCSELSMQPEVQKRKGILHFPVIASVSSVSTDFHFHKREPEQRLSVMVMVASAPRKRRNVESNWRNSSDNSKSSLLWPPKTLEGFSRRPRTSSTHAASASGSQSKEVMKSEDSLCS